MNSPTPKRQLSLARRILVAMSVVALVPLLIMAVQGLHCGRQAVVELGRLQLEAVLASRKLLLESWLSERGDDLQSAARFPCGRDGCSGLAGHPTPDHLEALLRFERDRGVYESFAVFDATGRSMGGWSEGGHPLLESLLDEDLKTKLAASTGLAASTTHPHDNGRIGLHLGMPIVLEGDDEVLLVVVNVNLDETLSVILEDRAGLGASTRLYLVSADGRYLTDPIPNAGVIGKPAPMPVEEIHLHDHRLRSYLYIAAAPTLKSSTRIPALNWILVAEEPSSHALGWLRVLARRAVLTGAATFLAVLWLATRFSRRLAEPLRNLAETARLIAAGSTRERVGALPGAEAEEVGHAFNEMLDSLAQAQQRVVQSASLAAIGELSVSVVHEMRNPLSSIKLNLQALRNKVAGDAAYAELAEIAGRQVSRLERMLTELLRFGKPLELRPAAVTFADLADDAMRILREPARERDVTLRCRDDTKGRTFIADREQLRRALENLVRNAIEASPEGGAVWIEGRVADDSAPLLEIRVRDHGNGIPESVRERLFQPFVTTRDEGTGLGLANVKKVVEMHDGNVHGENLPAGGASFVIAIPLGGGARS